jgi:Tol biopolymer transport system component
VDVIRLLVRTVVVSVLVCAPLHAEAQYFGRNKVEYENFDFRILATEHFDIYYYSQEEPAARIAARLAERWYARLSTVLNHTFDRRQPLVLYGSQAEFAQTNVVSGLLSDSIGGVTEGAKRRIVMPFAPTLAETDHVIGHELVHAFQFDISRTHGRDTGQPLWFIEGMAEYLSKGPLTGASTLWARDAVLSGRLPEKMNAAARDLSPYLFGHAFWSYIGERFGDQSVEKALKPGRKQRRLKDRFRHATGAELDEVYREWRAAMHEQYGDARDGRERYRSWDRDTMQIGPSVSPDGTRAVFFSERDRMSLDLFLVDLDRAQVIRKVATTAASAKFDSLQPLRSAGAWSPDGRWFAFAAVRQGRAALQLIDIRDDATPLRQPRVADAPGRGDRELIFPTLGQVLSPTWSPDGGSIAFSAIAGGWTDLYVADVASGALRRITNDGFADLHPAWSHDGRTIAFATERYSSDLETLRIGSPRLALLDVGTNVIRPLAVTTAGMQINPQWSKDDGELYFVGDPEGIANVLRVCLETNAVHQITNVATAVAGITPTGPALSVSADERTLAFTIYANGRPHLTVLDPDEVLAGARALRTSENTQIDTENTEGARNGDLVRRALADDQTGLSGASAPMVREYRPRLSLEGIGQPYLSSGGGPFGTFVRGGGALLFGDMLGERRLGAAVQIGNRLHDTAVELRYLNQERRWTWGGLAEVEPGIARFRTSSAVKFNGQEALLRQTEYFQRMQVRAAGLLAYPFSRGLRAEMFGGVRHAQYRRDQRVSVASAETGEIFDREQAAFSGGRPTTVAEFGAALVRDTTVFGPTGPLLGSRYRVEVAPAIGQLRYTSLLADVRHYLMPVRPFTVAMRMVHTGRYGRDGRDPRLLPSYLGSSYFVRGHRDDLRYCTPDATEVCGDELLGNRLLVGNLEVRFPLLGMRSRQLEYRVVPVDVFFFADGGIISGSGSRDPALRQAQGRPEQSRGAGAAGARHHSISSLGAGLRMSAGGLPLEIGAVRALDGPRPRWQFDLGFRVGF